MATPTPYDVKDGLTPELAKQYRRQAQAVWDQKRSTTTVHIYYSHLTGSWIEFKASTRYPGRFMLSYYRQCPCGG